MGTRQYGDDDSLAKRQSKMVKVISTTSAKLGVRIGGMQVVSYALYINLVKPDISVIVIMYALGFYKEKKYKLRKQMYTS